MKEGKFNWSAGANIGAGAAGGKYLLFLDNDIHVVQKWLGRMLGIAQRRSVLSDHALLAETAKIQDSGWISRLNGLAATPWNCEMELTEPGTWVVQSVIRTWAVGGTSTSHSSASVFDDFGASTRPISRCSTGHLISAFRSPEQGFKIIWTPYSMLVHYGGVSTHERRKDTVSALEDVIASKAEREGILQRWLPALASDPGYNRNLQSHRAIQARSHPLAPIVWDTNHLTVRGSWASR